MRYRITFIGGLPAHHGSLSLNDAILTTLRLARQQVIFIRLVSEFPDLYRHFVLEWSPVRGWCQWEGDRKDQEIHAGFVPLATAVDRALQPTNPPSGVPA